MNPLLLCFSLALIVAQFALPRRLAFLPLLIAACHTPYNVALGGQFTAVRLVLFAGLLRASTTGSVGWTTRNPLDVLLAVWSGLALLSSFGHDTGTPFVYRCGLVLNVFGTYLYFRAFVPRADDFRRLIVTLAWILLPLAVLLAFETATSANAYHAIGTRYAEAFVREGRHRAMGPFGNPILAGTLGAVCFPLFVAIWRRQRRPALIGIASSIVIIITSASSGPIGTLLLALGALMLWPWRRSLGTVKLSAIALIFIVQLFRERSVWYLLALIDFVGGSTGWHRARLLESALDHIGEWWLAGTDYTRHWMPYGLPSVPNHCDLTSYYVHLGVIGGLPLLIALIWILWRSFNLIGRKLRQLRAARSKDEFFVWCVGATLFAHTATFFTISYFDQLFVLFYLIVAAVPALVAMRVTVPAPAAPEAAPPEAIPVGS